MRTGGGAGDGFELEYWRPSPALAPYVSGYHRYTLRLAPGERHADVFFPGWANLRFSIGADPWSIRIGARSFPVPEAALFGPTSRAGYVECGRGTLFGIGLTPLGWARFFGDGADEAADRVVPPEGLLAAEAAFVLRELHAGRPAPGLFDEWLLGRLERTAPEPESVGTIFGLLADASLISAAALSLRSGIAPRPLVRETRRHFGFAPKLLLRRARFLRALLAVGGLDQGARAEAIAAAGYWDRSHFVRDCQSFLGMPLRDFLRLSKPIANASLELRARTLGAPVQGLHRTAR